MFRWGQASINVTCTTVDNFSNLVFDENGAIEEDNGPNAFTSKSVQICTDSFMHFLRREQPTTPTVSFELMIYKKLFRRICEISKSRCSSTIIYLSYFSIDAANYQRRYVEMFL